MRLASMEATDMLDAIHYLFEEDVMFVSSEQLAYKDAFRKNIYRELYKSDYIYVAKSDDNFGLDTLEGPLDSVDEPVPGEKINVFSPREKTAKPYVPPTSVSADDAKPFGSILDAPIN